MDTILKAKIRSYKDTLHKSILLGNSLHSREVLEISKELDSLILDYYKQEFTEKDQKQLCVK